MTLTLRQIREARIALKEQQDRPDAEQMLALAERTVADIKQKCGPWLKAVGKDIVFLRGYGAVKSWVFQRDTRTDRRPRDSGQDSHDAMNAAIAEAGLTANRSNAVFVTSDGDFAGSYSDDTATYIVFPVGEFNYTWSPDVEDAIHGAEGVQWRGDDNSLRDAAHSGHEVMISSTSTINVRASFYEAYIYDLLRGSRVDAEAAYERMMEDEGLFSSYKDYNGDPSPGSLANVYDSIDYLDADEVLTEAKIPFEDIGTSPAQQLLDTVDKVVKIIQQQCKPYLAEVGAKGPVMYRGTSYSGYAAVQAVRTDRKSKDSSKKIHDEMNASIAAHGLVANRSNAAFVSGDRYVAADYGDNGDAYVSIPIGSFKYTWSPRMSDATHEWSRLKTGQRDSWLTNDDLGLDMALTITAIKNLSKGNSRDQQTLQDNLDDAYGSLKRVKPKQREELNAALAAWKTTDLKKSNAPYYARVPYAKFIDAYRTVQRAYPSQSGAIITWMTIAALDCAATLAYLMGTNSPQLNIFKGDDGSLLQAIKSDNEIMIAAEKMLYIHEDVYKYLVGPVLQGKKVTLDNAKRTIEIMRDD